MVRKINKALLSGDAWGELYICLFQCVALIFCCFMIVMSLAGIVESHQNIIQNNIWFYFRRNGMVLPYVTILCSCIFSLLMMAITASNYNDWCYQYNEKQKLLRDDTDYRPADDWQDIKDGTAASIKLSICYWSFIVLSFAIIPGLIVLGVISSIIGIFHLCGHFIDYIASKTIYKPKTPERGMINEFNKLLDD
jgi:hypothetical protein